MTKTPSLILEKAMPLGGRLFWGGFGFVPLVWPALGLQPWTIPFGLFAIGMWVIVLGAAALGLIIILVMLFSPNETLRIEGNALTVRSIGLTGQTVRHYRAHDITTCNVQASSWSDGPDTYTVRLHFNEGRPFVSDTFYQKSDAENLLAEINNTLNQQS